VRDDFGEVAERLRRVTVQIRAGGSGCGSGVIWKADGQVVTNAHVVSQGRPLLQLWTGQEAAARVVRTDPKRDLALLHVESACGLQVAPGDSAMLRPGELVIAVGNPLGFVGAVSTGAVHSVGSFRGLGSRTWVASTVRLAPGNSGGPLANARGELIGVNTMIVGGMAFSVPSNVVADFVRGSGTSYPRLGVVARPVPLEKGREALLVVQVLPGSAAERASLRAGDLLTNTASLPRAGGLVEIEFRRGGSSRTRRVMAELAA
jgi:serine protease Do